MPHDFRVCLTWSVTGAGLPAATTTRCFEDPTAGEGSSGIGYGGFLSPGVHTLTLTAALPSSGGGIAGGAARASPLALAAASFVASYDEGVGVGVPLIAFEARSGLEHDYDARVAGALVTAAPGDACAALRAAAGAGAFAFDGAAARVSGVAGTTALYVRDGDGGGDDGAGLTPCEFWEARAALARAGMRAGYHGARDEALEWYLLANASLGGEGVHALVAASGGDAGDADSVPLPLRLDAQDYESHAAAASRICRQLLPPRLQPGGCATLLEPSLREVRASGRGFFVRAKRPDAAAVAGGLYPRVNELGYWPELDAMEAYLLTVGAPVLKGGTVDAVVSVARLLAALVQLPRAPPRTVCEIGVNGGHSSLLWLLGAPQAHVIAFDLGEHTPTWVGRYLARRFPGRYTLVLGDSTVEVPAWHRAHPDVLCDFW